MKTYKLHYNGSKVWPIIWAIVYFPIALCLLFVNGRLETNEERYYAKYDGSTFWLAFWTLFFFPVALLLLVLNGVSFIHEMGAKTASAAA